MKLLAIEFKYPTSDNQEITNFTQNDDNMVRLVIKQNDSKSFLTEKKNYGCLFDQQRLVLKSLYEIRRCRINNRDVCQLNFYHSFFNFISFKIVINSELNNLLIKQYKFDIRKNCRSLKELEKLLEIIAIEISEEFKKQNKRSNVIFFL